MINLKPPPNIQSKAADTRNWVIYKITNPSNRIYIGKTNDFNARVGHYKAAGSTVKRQRIIYNSIIKYGFDNHQFEIIDQFDSTENYAFGKEMFWIRSHMSNINKCRNGNGMNLTDGGDGVIGAKFLNRVSPMKGKRMSEKTKVFLSEYGKMNPSRGMLGKKHTNESRLKMSLSKKGKRSPHLGKKQSATALEKNKDKGKRVVRCELDGSNPIEFRSIKAAAFGSGMCDKSVSGIVNGITKSPKLFIFKYKSNWP